MKRLRVKTHYNDTDIASSDITPESTWLNRRALMRRAAIGGAVLAWGGAGGSVTAAPARSETAPLQYGPASPAIASASSVDEPLTPYADVTSYNNFYEFGTDKSDPARYAHEMTIDPWSINVGGLVDKPGTLHLEDLLGSFALEERIYRFRCVEAWSMVIPWIGFPLRDLLARFEPQSDARFVRFRSLYRPEEMRGTRSFTAVIDWPYQEALRLDEAMHPLAFIAVGLYGKTLPPQSGAPVRLVVPWKYGFKSIKSIVSIDLVQAQPETSWQRLAPREYGFYSNVNPEVDHPRWSQRYERRLPSSLLRPNRIPTRLFNGYADQVAGLYAGMDLAKFY